MNETGIVDFFFSFLHRFGGFFFSRTLQVEWTVFLFLALFPTLGPFLAYYAISEGVWRIESPAKASKKKTM
jgi:hypothetical protein